MKKYLIACILAIVLCSCAKSVLSWKGNMMNKKYAYDRFSNGDKMVAYIGVMHINSNEYYQKIKKDIDSLRAVGYSIMYEGVLNHKTPQNKEQQELLSKKLRKILGFHATTYIDSANQDMSTFNVKGFVNQTLENTGIDKNTDYLADLSVDKLLTLYEESKGPIILTKCDLETKLGDKYNCSKKNKENYKYLVLTLRNEHLANTVLAHQNNKIAILYGDLHKYGLLHNLKQHDPKWKLLPIQ